MSNTEEERTGHCAVCNKVVQLDGKQAAVMGGRVVCEECRDIPVAFVAECLDCGWAYRSEWHECERYVARQRVQQEANTHAAFEDSDHETAWREVEPETDGYGPDPGVVEGQDKNVTDGGRRHATDRVDGTVIAECPNIDEDPEEHLSFEVEYSDAADTTIFDELMETWPECGECGAELDAVHQQEPTEVIE